MIPNELNTEQAMKLVSDLADLKIWLLSIGGGEPFLRQDMMDILKYAKERGLCLNVSTNGMFLPWQAKQIVDIGVDSLTISIEGITPDVHNTIRRTPKLFENLIKGIEEVKKYRGDKKVPKIKIRTVVNKEMYDSMGEYIEFWKDKVDEVVMQPIHSFDLHKLKVPEELRFNKEDQEKFIRVFGELQEKYPFLRRTYYDEFKNFFFDPKKVREKYKCYAGYYMMHVNPDGKVYPCTSCVKYLGNLHESSFKDIWKGVEAQAFRKVIRNNENTCFCWYNCSGTFSSAFDPVLGKLK
jgi:radical SAM protein with 4Fe4S-binding SPASM domain